MPPPRRRTLGAAAAWVALAAGLLRVESARASAFEVSGFGAESVAELGARAARADDGTAAFHDPGGLAFGHGVRLALSPQLGVSALEVQGKTRTLDDPFGVGLSFDATVPLTGDLADRIRVGFGGYFPPTSAFRLLGRAGDEPLFPYYDNRTQRLVAIPALAVRPFDWLGIGVGLNVLAGVRGPADVRPGASGANEARIDEDASTVLAANLGVRWDPRRDLRLAFVYRQRFAIQSLVQTTAVVGGVPLAVDVDARQSLYDPDTFVLGASLDLGATTVELDSAYAIWSTYDGPFVALDAELPGVAIVSKSPPGLFKDTLTVRGAVTRRFLPAGRVVVEPRVALGWESSMLTDAQQGRTNLVDGDKILVGAGASLAVPVQSRVLRFGLGANVQIVPGYSQDKRTCAAAPCPATTVVGPDGAHPDRGITNPGWPRLEGSGVFVSTAATVGVEL